MEETILVCEDSLEGVLTAVYRAYEWKLKPDAVRVQIGQADLCLFAVYKEVPADAECAAKVAATVLRRFGADAYEDICHALAAEDEEKGQAVYRTIAAGLSGRIRGPLMEALADDSIRNVFELSRRVHNEVHRMKQFVRFHEAEGKLLYARIEPCADVVGLVMPHFADRFPLENFIIADTRRGIAGVHPAGGEWILTRPGAERMEEYGILRGHDTEEEKEMAELFRRFCHTINIKERKNTKVQKQFLPLKYRGFMTEFEENKGKN